MGVPVGTPIQASSGNVANAAAAAVLPARANATAYLAGFQITAGGATAAALVVATVTGLLGGTKSYVFAAPAGATAGATPLAVNFDPPLPASAQNQAITVTLPALGAGNTNAVAEANGFYA